MGREKTKLERQVGADYSMAWGQGKELVLHL